MTHTEDNPNYANLDSLRVRPVERAEDTAIQDAVEEQPKRPERKRLALECTKLTRSLAPKLDKQLSTLL